MRTVFFIVKEQANPCNVLGRKAKFSNPFQLFARKCRFRADTNNRSADSTLCTANDCYAVFSAKHVFSNTFQFIDYAIYLSFRYFVSPMLHYLIQCHALGKLKHRRSDQTGKFPFHYGKPLWIVHYFTDGYISTF